MQRPIFILGAHKSGTSLLRSLFDGHPDAFTVPIEAHFFENMAWWVDYAYRRTLPEPLSRAAFIARATGWVQHCNTSADPQADSIAQGRFDVPHFRTRLAALLPEAAPAAAPAPYLAAYLGALHEALYHAPLDPSKRIVEKSVENVEFALDLHALFPAARFVHIVRNPYANLVSIRKYKAAGRYPWMGPAIRSLYSSCYHLYRNRRLLPHYHVLQYEAFVQHPEATVRALCEAVALDYDASMLTPTAGGQPWGGNSTSHEAFSGISSARLHRWADEIVPLEVALVNKYLAHVVTDFGYEALTPAASVYRRNRQEPLKHYLANRLVYRATQY